MQADVIEPLIATIAKAWHAPKAADMGRRQLLWEQESPPCTVLNIGTRTEQTPWPDGARSGSQLS